MPTAQEIRAQLPGPGGPFEIVEETVEGTPMLVYKERFNDLRVVAAFGQSHGEKTFIVHGDERITFTDFMRNANSVSRRLGEFGVGHGDRVAVLSANNPEWCLSFWGTVDIGAILVGLNGWWITDEIVYGLTDSGARVLVADRRRFERVAEEVDRIDTLEHVFLIDADPSEFAAADGSVSPKLHRFDELLTDPTDELPTVPIDEGDAAVIFYTSGTTGRPKGAISTHRSMIANLQNTVFLLTAGAMGQPADDREADAPPTDGSGQPVSLLTSPLFHVSGCHSGLVVGMMAGIRLVILPGRFTPEAAFDAIERERVMIWATVPTMIWRACEHPDRHDRDLRSIIAVSFGGSPSADELQRRIRETFPNVKATTNAYGLTESSAVATALAGDDALRKPDSVGLPVPNTQIAIAGPDGTHLGPGETGEVLIRGPLIMAGYWNKPEADPGRRERLLRRDREPPRRAPRHRGRRGGRRSPRRVGRGGQGGHRGRRRRRHLRRRGAGLGGRHARRVQGPDLRATLGRQAAPQRVGQAAQERDPRRRRCQLRRDDVAIEPTPRSA